jgi:uncharacterized protein YktB (UPF0637 family)
MRKIMTTVAPELNWGERELAIFRIEGFNERMSEIRAQIQPKLRAIGERLREPVSRICNQTSYPHVAKHMRRTVNPPPETWVAFGPSARGYKQFSHFAFVVSEGGLHTRLIVKSEAPDRFEQAERLRKSARKLVSATKVLPMRAYGQWDYQGLPALITNNEKFWQEAAERLALKTGGLDLGIGFEKEAAKKLTEADITRAFEQLAPIYLALTK